MNLLEHFNNYKKHTNGDAGAASTLVLCLVVKDLEDTIVSIYADLMKGKNETDLSGGDSVSDR